MVKSESIAVGSFFTAYARLEPVRFSELRTTVPIGPNFGPGPRFSMNANVSPNVPYQISVRAVDAQGSNGPISAVWEFTWHVPVPPDVVQWPFRSLPAAGAFHPAIQARLLSNYVNQVRFLNQDYPVGVRIGAVPDGSIGFNSDMREVAIEGSQNQEKLLDPHRYLFRRNPSATTPPPGAESLLPVALYRHQVTNVNFPKVSGDVTQVSPLIEKFPVLRELFFQDATYVRYRIVDRLIGHSSDLEFEMPGELDNAHDGYHGIYLHDTQPVIGGATYRYYLVRFKANHEVDQIIPAGDVTLP
jgi:hypothetical protein